jgi:3-dehydroquinate dehydratase
VRVAVLNGVNLDVVGRRNPELYGGLSLSQLESRIYEWGRDLELNDVRRALDELIAD